MESERRTSSMIGYSCWCEDSSSTSSCDKGIPLIRFSTIRYIKLVDTKYFCYLRGLLSDSRPETGGRAGPRTTDHASRTTFELLESCLDVEAQSTHPGTRA